MLSQAPVCYVVYPNIYPRSETGADWGVICATLKWVQVGFN